MTFLHGGFGMVLNKVGRVTNLHNINFFLLMQPFYSLVVLILKVGGSSENRRYHNSKL